MNCKNLRIRTKNYKKYFYCVANKCIVDASTCYCCAQKEYKAAKPLKATPIKKKTHKVSTMSKACDIPEAVKFDVWERDEHKCIFCHRLVPMKFANAHFIPRSQGGLGIAQNIVTACPHCHHEQDNGQNSTQYDLIAEEYLKSIYGAYWNIKSLIYSKWGNEDG